MNRSVPPSPRRCVALAVPRSPRRRRSRRSRSATSRRIRSPRSSCSPTATCRRPAINVETVRLAGGPEIVSQVATGQLQLGGAGMGAAGFNAVVSGLPVEYVAPLHVGYVEDYFVVRKALWGKEVKRIADLKGRTVALNIRGAAVEWMLDQALRRDGLTIKDVQVKLMPFPDMVPALESGAVDAAHPVRAVPDPRRGEGRRGAPADARRRAPSRADHRDLLEQGVGEGATPTSPSG